jgi:hypothetical protein
MLKKTFLLLLLFILTTSPVDAAIETTKPTATNGAMIISRFEGHEPITLDTFNYVYFGKKFYPADAQYFVHLAIDAHKAFWYFQDNAIEIKVDGETLVINNTAANNNNLFGALRRSESTTTINSKIVEKIAVANKVSIKAFFFNKPTIHWEVPADMLQEWKSVIKSSGKSE